jgi:hypothetical protein
MENASSSQTSVDELVGKVLNIDLNGKAAATDENNGKKLGQYVNTVLVSLSMLSYIAITREQAQEVDAE